MVTATKVVIVVFSLICIAEIAWMVFMLTKYKDMDTMRFQSQTINLADTKAAVIAYWTKGDNGKIDCRINGICTPFKHDGVSIPTAMAYQFL